MRSRTDSTDCSSIYTPFSKTGTEWLSSNQIERGLLYLLHAKFQQARHRCFADIRTCKGPRTQLPQMRSSLQSFMKQAVETSLKMLWALPRS